MLFFAVVVGIAASRFRQPDIHKRLMVLATVSVLVPAIARVFLVVVTGGTSIVPPPRHVTLGPSFVTNLLLVAMQVLRIPFAYTAAWQSMADALTRVGPR